MKQKEQWIRTRFAGALTSFGVLACAGTVLGLMGGLWWGFDLATHFRVQYLIVLGVVMPLLLMMRRRKTAGAFAAFAVLNALFVVPLYTGPGGQRSVEGPRCRILISNVLTENHEFDVFEAYVRQEQPDILVLIEVDDAWVEALESIEDMLPYCTSDPRSDNFGIAVYSRIPPRSAKVERIGPAAVRSIVVEFGSGDEWFTMIATHPVPPQGRLGSEVRNAQLAELGRLVEMIETPVLLVGDLNTTPWSHHYRRLTRETGLVNASRGHGVRATWPSAFPSPMRIPIDHCLCSDGFEVLSTHVGRDVGSDHLPLVVDLRVPCDLEPRVARDVRAGP